MSKKSTKALASATLMSLVLTTALSAGPVKAAQGPVTRVGGGDRYATAATVATKNWTTSDNVVLVSGEGYADAVSASALAKKLNAPILLTTSNSLSSEAETALNTLKPKTVYVVGGNASISQSIRDGLKSKYTLKELGGQNRYETNVAVAKELVSLGVSASNVMVVGGEGYSDALSVAPVAAAKGQILLLANNNKDSIQSVINFVKDNSSKVTIVGTTGVISDAIKGALGSDATRVNGGTDRFATNLAVLNQFKSDLKTDHLYVANASSATPDNLYADALVASALAGKYTAPLVLVDKDKTTATDNAVTYIKGENAKDIEVIGGTAVVPDSIIEEITGKTPTPTDAAVSSISSNGLNQIKVVFNGEVDEDTAETISNYKVDGTTLNDNGTKDNVTAPDGNSAKAVLQDDNKTVLITLSKARKQSDSVDVTVKKGILSSDKSQTVPELTQAVSFNDTTAPTIQSVEARGNNKLTVKFSEPLNLAGTTVSNIASKFKINDKNITSFGLDTGSYSAVDDYVIGNNNTPSNPEVWSNKIEFYFNTQLPNGNNTLKITDGDETQSNGSAGKLSSAGQFPFKETSQTFDVSTMTGAPQITGISAEDNGKIYVNFDRPMDTKTAKTATYYGINGDDNHPAAGDIDLKKGDTQVKISNVSGKLNKNSNTIYIKNDVKDAYGNKVADDTRKPFNLDEDTTKPTVSSVSALDDTTIRVRFSKDVDAVYATNVSNYKLRDNSGTVITDEIVAKNPASSSYQDNQAITIPGKSKKPNDGDSTDVVDLHVNKKLTDAKYTLTIKNIIDTAKTPNTMDDVDMPFDGSNDVTPTVTGTYVLSSNVEDYQQKVIVYFNKEMDSSSLSDVSNYKFTNASGDYNQLPSGTTITPSNDNKSAVVKFPSSYGTSVSSKTGDNLVTALDVIGVKDVNGKTLGVAYSGTIGNTNPNLAVIDPNSVRFTYVDASGNLTDDLSVQFKFKNPIDSLDFTDFRVNGVEPSTGSLNGDVVTLKFNDGDAALGVVANNTVTPATPATLEVLASGFKGQSAKYNPTKAEAVKFDGKAALITTVPQADIHTTDVSGSKITEIKASDNIKAYDYSSAPKTIADEWNAGAIDASNSYVDVVFDTPIDSNGINVDDFVFNDGNGNTLTPTSASISDGTGVGNEGNTVRFKFNTPISSFKGIVKVRIKSTASIKTPKDADNTNAYYKASSDDTAPRTITIGTVGAVK
ncbi:cell wall-binding repeat-containing protein [Clostridium sp. AWRP]|uniref:cell wall-binding repeat-containing protein n=1 Tax=Clostridium sp. AWRP TaxID=2212991 RepID=UPI000FD94B19|nr:cell wall-binding repeat-containing protein [Clostridium sp. AWRP]AZV55487.1 cell wall-binding repeat-containing protein [Clostridium sp. AWRP]